MTAVDDERFEGVINGWLHPSQLDDRKLSQNYPAVIRRLMADNALDSNLRKAYDALTVELYARTDEVLRSGLLEAAQTMVELMQDYSNDPAIRLRAAQWLVERFRGKTPEVVEIRQDKPFEMMLQRIVSGPRIIDAERPVEIEEAQIVEAPKKAQVLRYLQEEQEMMDNWKGWGDAEGD